MENIDYVTLNREKRKFEKSAKAIEENELHYIKSELNLAK
jgi:hypothetical protein